MPEAPRKADLSGLMSLGRYELATCRVPQAPNSPRLTGFRDSVGRKLPPLHLLHQVFRL